MSFPPLFKDHGKTASDLLGKGFPSTDRFIWKFEADTIANNGIQFLPNISYDGNVSAEFKVKAKTRDCVTTLSSKTDNSVSIESVCSKNFAGFKPTLTLTSGFSNLYKFKTKISAENRSEKFNATVFVEIPNPLFKDDQDNKVGASFVSDLTGGISAGADLEANVDKRNLDKFNAVVAYTQNDAQVCLFGKKTYGVKSSVVLGMNCYQRLSTNWNNLIIAAEMSHTVDGPNSFLLGTQFNPDAFSSIKLRMRNTGSLGFSYSQHWGGPFTLTFMGETGKLIGAENPLTWGVKLSLK
jgi:hypothetical protein